MDEFLNLGYVPELKYFVDCVMNDLDPFYGVDAKAALACLEIVQDFYESNKTGKTITGEWI